MGLNDSKEYAVIPNNSSSNSSGKSQKYSLALRSDQCESEISIAAKSRTSERQLDQPAPTSGGAVMLAAPINQLSVKQERMVRVEERTARDKAVPCSMAESGARLLVRAGLARWTNRGTTIRLCTPRLSRGV
jgi:hypothetical protein